MHPWERCSLYAERQCKAVVRDVGPRAGHRSAPFSAGPGQLNLWASASSSCPTGKTEVPALCEG